jgi:L-ascorbate metabolism protein UlaG (beta-lactamase superfamily)
MSFFLRWLGNAGYELKIGKQTLLIDPFLTRPHPKNIYFGRVSPDLAAIEHHIQKADHILVSHAHFDHFMDVPAIARRTGAVIHGSGNSCRLAQAQGIPAEKTHPISDYDTFFLGDIEIQAIPAAHPWLPVYTNGQLNQVNRIPMRLRDYRMDGCFSFLVTYQGKRLLVWSSISTTGALPADIVICRAVSGRGWYKRLFSAVRPKIVIPSHWDDMFAPLSEPVRPFFSPPRLAWPPLERIDLKKFEDKVIETWPECRVMIPQRFIEFPIEV